MLSKICSNCKQELPLSEFYIDRSKSKNGKEGYKCYCKNCDNKRVKEYYQKNKDKIKECNKKYNKKYRKTEKGKESHKNSVIKWQKNNFKKDKTHQKLKYAVASGKIIKPKICSICNKTNCKIEGHHPDYSKPLEVIWCCIECHNDIHNNNSVFLLTR